MGIQGKRVVVTGASSGIGRELVRLLVEHGCQVVCASRRTGRIGVESPRVHEIACDVSLSGDVDRLFDFAVQTMGDIDVFIANAGFAYHEHLVEANWNHVSTLFDTNVVSVCYAAAKMKHLHKDCPFQFMATASAMSFLSLPGYALYSASKAALRGFADAFRFDLAKGQLIQTVYPVATRTEFFDVAGGADKPWPVQSAHHVALCMLKALETGRRSVYPSTLFWMMHHLFPFVKPAYARLQARRWRNAMGKEDSHGSN